MKQYAIVTLLCLVSSALGSMLTLYLADGRAEPLAVRPPAEPQAEPEALTTLSLEELAVKRLAITDAQGRERIVVGPCESCDDPETPRIALLGIDRVPLLILATTAQGAFLELQNSELPNALHKRIRIDVGAAATIEMGHGEVEEIALRSAPPEAPTRSIIVLRSRNSSSAALFLDDYGHATLEVTDLAANSVLRAPEWQPLLPD